jgi:hypothetical protein
MNYFKYFSLPFFSVFSVQLSAFSIQLTAYRPVRWLIFLPLRFWSKKREKIIDFICFFVCMVKKQTLSLHPLLEGTPERDFLKEAKEAIFRRLTYTFKDKAAYTRVLYMGKNIRNTLVPVQ